MPDLTLSREEIKELRRLHDEATAGPWIVKWSPNLGSRGRWVVRGGFERVETRLPNLHLIARVRNRLPALLAMASGCAEAKAELLALRREVADARVGTGRREE